MEFDKLDSVQDPGGPLAAAAAELDCGFLGFEGLG